MAYRGSRSSPATKPLSAARRLEWLSWDLALEVLLLALVASIFGLMIFGTRGWPAGAAFFPRMSAMIGIPLFALHVLLRIKDEWQSRSGGASQARAQSRILDVGFDDAGADEELSRKRSIQMLGSTGALFVGIWLFGFHVAVPAYVFLMLIAYGRVKWWWAAIPAILFEAVILGVYGYLLHTPWNDPALLQLFR